MKKKILAMCLVVALLATAIVGATLAYFTDTTDKVQNTFTMGNVTITLDEAAVDTDDKAIPNADRVIKNEYSNKMVPGHVFDKDPTIHVADDSEDCYVFLDIEFNRFNSLAWVMAKEHGVADTYITNGKFSSSAFAQDMMANKEMRIAILNKWFSGIEHVNWEIKDVKVEGDYMTIRLAYIGAGDPILSGGDDVCFMTAVKMPETVTQQMIDAAKVDGGMQNVFNAGSLHMNLTAYAIQADELATVADAYAALFNP